MSLIHGRSLRWQIAFLSSTVMMLVVLIYSAYTVVEQSGLLRENFERQMRAVGAGLAAGSADAMVRDDLAGLEVLALRTASYPGVLRLEIVDLDGKRMTSVVAGGGGGPEVRFEGGNVAVPSGETPPVAYPGDQTTSLMHLLTGFSKGARGILWSPVTVGETIGWVRVEFSSDEIHDAIAHVWEDSVTASFLGLALGLGVIMLFLHRPTRALEETAAFARRLDQHGNDSLAVWQGTAEIRILGEALNHANDRLDGQHLELLAQQRHLRQMAGELEVERDRANAASKAKSEFLANMSHEIRTPMNGVLGMAELLDATPLNDEQKNYLRMLKVSSDNLLSIINDILDFSKIEAGKLAMESVEFSLSQNLDDTMHAMALLATEKGIALHYDVDDRVPDRVLGDPVRLRQIITNLTGNAIKFTEAGDVIVRVKIEKREGDDALLHFTVSDTGIGIPEDKLSSIFGVFSQADASTTRRFGGTGLGLSISRSLVEMMDGRIWAESTPGQGSVFHFTVRLGIGADSPETVEGHAVLAGMRILLADGSRVGLELLDTAVRGQDAETVCVADGEAALEALSGMDVGKRFDFAILDASLPKLGGLDIVERLRTRGHTARIGFVVLVDAGQCTDSCCSGSAENARCLFRPVGRRKLIETMVAMHAGLAEGSKAAEPDAARLTQPPRILVAEDNPMNQKVTLALLTRHGYLPTLAENGRRAFELSDAERFDAILMDVQMPLMDGYEATRAIREREAKLDLPRLPIIGLSANAMAGDRERAIAAGMDGYVTKPVIMKDLIEVLSGIGSVTDEGYQVAMRGHNGREPGSPGQIAGEDFIAVALDRCEGDRALMEELANVFLADWGRQLQEMEKTLKAGDAEALARAVHAAKGMVVVFSRGAALEAVRALEALAGVGDLAAAGKAYEKLAAESGIILAALGKFCEEQASRAER